MKLFQLSDRYDDERRTLTIAGRVHVWWPFPIATMLNSSMAVVLGYPIYAEETPRWIRGVGRIARRIEDTKYWIKYRFHPTRYHHVDTGLYPGYLDPRTVLLYAAFASLKRYVDERGGVEGMRDYIKEFSEAEPLEQCREQAKTEQEILSIWLWWTEELPAMKTQREEWCHELFGEKRRMTIPFTDEEEELHTKYRALEQRISDEKRQMLHRLVDVRECLWT